MPRLETVSEASIARAVEFLRNDGLVAFPTETVYGLGANAAEDKAVLRIFEAKGRPRFNPLIVHVRNLEHAISLAEFSPTALKLAETFWPGPLTLVLQRLAAAPLSLLASAGLETVALRAPAHPVAQEILAQSRLAIAAPSANRSGSISATHAEHVTASLGANVDLVLDGGPTSLGLESTIIGFDDDRPILMRPGAIEREPIEALVGSLQTFEGKAVTAPGQLRSHYAPRTPIRLNAWTIADDEALLAFGPQVPANAKFVRNLSPSGDIREAAANLFAMLHELDAANSICIAVMPIPEAGLGEAINDRLRRAAAPRDE